MFEPVRAVTVADAGRRVAYRFQGKGTVYLYGAIQRPARSYKYGDGAMVLWDDRVKPQFAYLRDLEWTDVPALDLSWEGVYSITRRHMEEQTYSALETSDVDV